MILSAGQSPTEHATCLASTYGRAGNGKKPVSTRLQRAFWKTAPADECSGMEALR